MKLVLLQDVKGQGKKGELIDVSDGYARNFLLPKKLAVVADAAAMNEIKTKEAAKQFRIEEEKKAAKEIAAKLEATVVKLFVKAGADGKLYGSVTAMDVTAALEKQTGLQIDKRKIQLPEPIRAFGNYDLDCKLYPEISGKIHLIVTDKD